MTAENIEALPYRPCVGAVVFNRAGLVFAGRRADMNAGTPAWQMPQGGIDEGEDPRDAVLRECLEEIGTDKVDILAESATWYTYDLPADLIGRTWSGRYRGQKQKWFALHFTGADCDIDLNATGHPEFSDWQWVPIRDVPALIVPFKREVYEAVVDEFAYLATQLSGEN